MPLERAFAPIELYPAAQRPEIYLISVVAALAALPFNSITITSIPLSPMFSGKWVTAGVYWASSALALMSSRLSIRKSEPRLGVGEKHRNPGWMAVHDRLLVRTVVHLQNPYLVVFAQYRVMFGINLGRILSREGWGRNRRTTPHRKPSVAITCFLPVLVGFVETHLTRLQRRYRCQSGLQFGSVLGHYLQFDDTARIGYPERPFMRYFLF
jgi:hypothetical protein